jgi:diguanylate cyclase (GGDEF)-like protein/PAS domain S-box-containing protein
MPLTQMLDLAELVDLLPDLVCAVGTDGAFRYVSAACEPLLGYRSEEMQGRLMLDFVHPDDHRRTLDMARQVIAGQPQLNFENRYLHRDGHVVHLMWTARWSDRKQLRIAVARDISDRKQQEQLYRARYLLSEAVHETEDLDGLYREIQSALATVLPAANCSIALCTSAAGPLQLVYCAEESLTVPTAAPQTSLPWHNEVLGGGQALLQQRSDADGPLSWLGAPLHAANGLCGVLALQTRAPAAPYTAADLRLLESLADQIAAAIERKQRYEQQEFLALHDPLTGLPNRRLFEDRLEGALARSRRNATHFVLLFVDLDDFKQVNDTLGHDIGDLLLQQVGRRLRDSVRRCDTVARFGGDEFVLLLENLASIELAQQLQDKIRAAFAAPFHFGKGRSLSLQPSIGKAVYPEHGSDAHSLLEHADQDMYRVKAAP